MKFCRPFHLTGSVVVLSILCAQTLGANTPINVDGDRGADKGYVVDAAFDVNVPAPIAWEVLTDYEGMGVFVSSIRHSTVREHDQRVLPFRDVCGKSFSSYEGAWVLAKSAIRGSVKQLLDDVRAEMLTRGAR